MARRRNYGETRDGILTILNNYYLPPAVGKAFISLNMSKSVKASIQCDLTVSILAVIVNFYTRQGPRDEDDLLVDEIHNLIWMYYSGGGTASNCANDIADFLGIPKGED